MELIESRDGVGMMLAESFQFHDDRVCYVWVQLDIWTSKRIWLLSHMTIVL